MNDIIKQLDKIIEEANSLTNDEYLALVHDTIEKEKTGFSFPPVFEEISQVESRFTRHIVLKTSFKSEEATRTIQSPLYCMVRESAFSVTFTDSSCLLPHSTLTGNEYLDPEMALFGDLQRLVA